MIERITRYRYDNQEFDDLKSVAKYIENEIGRIIDLTPNRLNPKDAIAVYDALIKNRKRLMKLLEAADDSTFGSIFNVR